MSGLYFHIPFCRKACHYCDFHFSTSLKHKENVIDALITELQQRKGFIQTPIESIYFGGGTPSVLSQLELDKIFSSIYKNFTIRNNAEITFECNVEYNIGFNVESNIAVNVGFFTGINTGINIELDIGFNFESNTGSNS